MKKPLTVLILIVLAVTTTVVMFLQSCRKPAEKVRVGYIPIADCSQLFVAIENGYFRDEGLEVEPVSLPGGSKILEALGSNSLEIGFSNLASLVLAHDAGLPFVAFTGGPAEDAQHKEHAIMLKQGSGIKRVPDLAGKRIALNTRKNIDELMITLLLRKHGLGPDQVSFVEVPFPRMINVLQAGDVDAAAAIEPFVTFGSKQGNVVLSYNYLEIQPMTDISSFVATTNWLERNPGVAVRFRRALQKATDFANSHESETKAILSKYTRLDHEQLKDVTLPFFTNSVSEERLNELIARMHDLAWIKTTFKAKDLIR